MRLLCCPSSWNARSHGQAPDCVHGATSGGTGPPAAVSTVRTRSTRHRADPSLCHVHKAAARRDSDQSTRGDPQCDRRSGASTRASRPQTGSFDPRPACRPPILAPFLPAHDPLVVEYKARCAQRQPYRQDQPGCHSRGPLVIRHARLSTCCPRVRQGCPTRGRSTLG